MIFDLRVRIKLQNAILLMVYLSSKFDPANDLRDRAIDLWERRAFVIPALYTRSLSKNVGITIDLCTVDL